MNYGIYTIILVLTLQCTVSVCQDIRSEFKLTENIEEIENGISRLKSIIKSLPPAELAELPLYLQGHRMEPALLKEGHQSCWIQIDLGKTITPELIAIIPQFRKNGNPDGFPSHFQVTLSTDPSAESSHLLADYSQTPYLIRREKFLLITNDTSASGRYLRITPSYFGEINPQLVENVDDFKCALSEVFVFKGEHNVALGASVSSSVKEVPSDVQKLSNLTDGWSPFGAPEAQSPPSLWEGYHSFHSGGKTVPPKPYWIDIDLGEVKSINQVNLIPVNPNSFQHRAGYGFPIRFKLEASTDNDFSSADTIFDTEETDFPVPSSHHISFDGNDIPARYIRLTVSKLFRGGWDAAFFSVAEMQVISDGKNVSERKPTRSYQSLDQLYYPGIIESIESSTDKEVLSTWRSLNEVEKKGFVRKKYNETIAAGGLVWAETALVDGFSSRQKLIPFPDWLQKAHQRIEAEFALRRLVLMREKQLSKIANLSKNRMYATFIVGSLLVLISIIFVLKISANNRRTMRTRLAQDLHDDLSSEICNISLIAQQLEASKAVERESDQKRLRSLIDSSLRTVGSLRDLIFLTNNDAQDWGQAISHLRSIPETLLAPLGISYSFSATDHKLTLKKTAPGMLRNVILIYKEALHNVCKHSGANLVKISVAVVSNRLTIEIEDNGRGFQQSKESPRGVGLWSMRMRAKEIGGSVNIKTDEESGTRVVIETQM